MATRLPPLRMTTLAAALALAATTAGAGLAPPMHLMVNATGEGMENTGRNVRDRADTTATPEDQKESKADVAVTAAVRKAVVADKSLSVNAHNVKVITRGVARVDNQLDIKAP